MRKGFFMGLVRCRIMDAAKWVWRSAHVLANLAAQLDRDLSARRAGSWTTLCRRGRPRLDLYYSLEGYAR